jgi:hypothetical protein
MANRIGKYMDQSGTIFINEATPTKLEKAEKDGQITVTYT